MADIEVLKGLGISGMAIHYFYASSTLLQEGVKAGLCLFEIAVCCYRDDDIDLVPKDPSPLELIVFRAFEMLTSLLKTDCRCYASASRAIADAIGCAPNALPPKPSEAIDLCELTDISKLFISASESPDSKDWACGIVDRAMSMKFESFDISVLQHIDDDLVSRHYGEFVDSLITREVSSLLSTRGASSEI